MHVYAFTHIGGLIFLFVFGAWTVLTILCGIQISTNIYPTIAFVGIIGAVLTYASCMYKKGYLKGKLHIEQKSMSKQDNICIWNGVLLLFVAIIPEVLALAYILIKLKAS